MGIEFFTGFEGCSSNTHCYRLFDLYSGYIYYSATEGFNGSKGLMGSGITIGSAYDSYVQKNITPAKTVVAGLHFKNVYHSLDSQGPLFKFYGPNVTIYNNTDGIRVYLNDVYMYTAGFDIISPNWQHIECKIFSDATAGTFQLKVNGGLIVDLSDINTGGSDITSVRFGSTGMNMTYRDNIFIADDWQGELLCYSVPLASDDSVGFTPSTGTDNYALVSTDDGDTSYVTSDTINTKDIYTLDGLPTGYLPLALSIGVSARKEGTGVRKIAALAVQDSTEYDLGTSPAFALYPAYPALATEMIHKNLSLAPDGTTWTKAKVDALKVGFKITD